IVDDRLVATEAGASRREEREGIEEHAATSARHRREPVAHDHDGVSALGGAGLQGRGLVAGGNPRPDHEVVDDRGPLRRCRGLALGARGGPRRDDRQDDRCHGAGQDGQNGYSGPAAATVAWTLRWVSETDALTCAAALRARVNWGPAAANRSTRGR